MKTLTGDGRWAGDTGQPHSWQPYRLRRRLRSERAVAFDTDGVITDSARSHAAAWKQAYDACMSERERER